MLADIDTARKAAKSKGFARWFRDFKRDVHTPGGAPAHYAASIDEADASTFRACAEDIVALLRGARMAKIYAGLPVPKIFYYGGSTGGQSNRSVDFLQTRGCQTIRFARAEHFPMTETPAQFERELASSLATLGKARRPS